MVRPATRDRAVCGFVLAVLAASAMGFGIPVVDTAMAQSAKAKAPGAVPEPADYRTDEYRAPVPATLQGGTVIDTVKAKTLHDAGVPFVDVLPRAPKPKGLPAGTIWHPKPRRDIPGSLWLVDTGYGDLAPVMEAYLMDGLARNHRRRHGQAGRPVLPKRLLDELQRRQARRQGRLFQGLLVSGRHRWLGQGRL